MDASEAVSEAQIARDALNPDQALRDRLIRLLSYSDNYLNATRRTLNEVLDDPYRTIQHFDFLLDIEFIRIKFFDCLVCVIRYLVQGAAGRFELIIGVQ